MSGPPLDWHTSIMVQFEGAKATSLDTSEKQSSAKCLVQSSRTTSPKVMRTALGVQGHVEVSRGMLISHRQ